MASEHYLQKEKRKTPFSQIIELQGHGSPFQESFLRKSKE